jgi:hypothetical protein
VNNKDAKEQATQWFAEWQAHFDRGANSDGIDGIYDNLDDALLDGHFEVVREVFKLALVKTTLRRSGYLSMLTISRPWRAKLQPEFDALRDAQPRELVRHLYTTT